MVKDQATIITQNLEHPKNGLKTFDSVSQIIHKNINKYYKYTEE